LTVAHIYKLRNPNILRNKKHNGSHLAYFLFSIELLSRKVYIRFSVTL